MDYAQPERLPGHAFIGAGGGPGKERSCAWKAACYNTFAQRTLGVTLPTLPTLVGPTLDHIFLAQLTLATHHHPAHPGTPRRIPAKPACTPGACARTKPCPSSGAFTCSANIDNPNPPLSYTGSSQERRTVLALGARLGASPGATDLRGGSRAPPPAPQKASPHGQRVGWVQYAHVASARHGAHDPFLMFRPLGHFGSAMRRRSA